MMLWYRLVGQVFVPESQHTSEPQGMARRSVGRTDGVLAAGSAVGGVVSPDTLQHLTEVRQRTGDIGHLLLTGLS